MRKKREPLIGPDPQGFNTPTTFFSVHLTPNETEAYEAGKAEGRRLERRALRMHMNKFRKDTELRVAWGFCVRFIDNWLASRAKPAKRKGWTQNRFGAWIPPAKRKERGKERRDANIQSSPASC